MLNTMRIPFRRYVQSAHIAEFILSQKILQGPSFIALDVQRLKEDSMVLSEKHPEDEADSERGPQNS